MAVETCRNEVSEKERKVKEVEEQAMARMQGIVREACGTVQEYQTALNEEMERSKVEVERQESKEATLLREVEMEAELRHKRALVDMQQAVQQRMAQAENEIRTIANSLVQAEAREAELAKRLNDSSVSVENGRVAVATLRSELEHQAQRAMREQEALVASAAAAQHRITSEEARAYIGTLETEMESEMQAIVARTEHA